MGSMGNVRKGSGERNDSEDRRSERSKFTKKRTLFFADMAAKNKDGRKRNHVSNTATGQNERRSNRWQQRKERTSKK